MVMSPGDQRLARISLAFVWLWTAFVSAQQAHYMSRDLLRASDLVPLSLYPWAIWGGAAVDLALGLWMAWRPARHTYLIALCMTLLMTLLASWVDARLWLHPLGPLSKNVPIIALLWLLAKGAPK